MRRPGPRLLTPRGVPGAEGGLSPAPLSSALLVDQAQPLTPVWQRWLTALRDAVTRLEAGGGSGGSGGDADTLDGLDSTDFVQKPMPLADLPHHALTHVGGGIDPLPYVDLPEAAPASPPADHARLFALDVNGFTQVEMRDSAGKGARFAADNILIAKVTEPAGVTRGQVLYIAGASGANSLARLARANDITTMPGIGLALDTGALNAFVRVLIAGTLQQLDTAAWVEGAALFVSATTAGALTATPPLAPDFTQRLGFVTRSHATAGETLVLSTGMVTPPRLHAATHSSGGTDPVTVTALAGYPGGTTNFLRADGTFATPAAGVPGPHHATHEPGGSDALVNAAWTNLANVFTQDQALQSSAPALKLNDISQGADARLFLVRNAGQYFRVDAYNDALTVQTGSCVMDRAGGWHVGGHSYVIGNATVGGLLTVNGFGTHSFSASGTGYQNFIIQNTADGAGNAALIDIRAGSTITQLLTYAPSWSTSGPSIAGSTLLYAGGAGGLGLFANHVSGAIRFYSGGATERMRLDATGSLWVNGGSSPFAPKVFIAADASVNNPLVLQNLYAANAGQLIVFANSANVVAGQISQTGATTVAYNTTSDQRLKHDRGIAADLTGLRAVVVHDFAWHADGTADRGIFAQETQPVFPRAVTVGGDLDRPWMTDYSKFVPDLIVGWQDHDARLAALEARLKDR